TAARELSPIENPPGHPGLVGVGGTFTTLAAVRDAMLGRPVNPHGARISAQEVEAQVRMYASRTVEERKRIPGLNPDRADIILAGAIIVAQAMNRFRVDHVSVSARGLRWGLLYDRFGSECNEVNRSA